MRPNAEKNREKNGCQPRLTAHHHPQEPRLILAADSGNINYLDLARICDFAKSSCRANGSQIAGRASAAE